MKKILSVLMALVLVSLMLPAAAEDAGEALKDAADTAVQTAEAAHRRRAKKS